MNTSPVVILLTQQAQVHDIVFYVVLDIDFHFFLRHFYATSRYFSIKKFIFPPTASFHKQKKFENFEKILRVRLNFVGPIFGFKRFHAMFRVVALEVFLALCNNVCNPFQR